MKKIYLFLIVLFFSTSSKAVCPTPPGYQPGHCQIPKGALENGEIVYKETYCKGDFPYCDNWTGDCCSETGYATENGGVCCHDPNKYVKHLVGMINPGGVSLSVNTYKCCDVATYGKKSTYYFDKEGHVQCCGGAVYQEKTGGDKNCCNPEFDEGGNVTRYHTVVDVKGGLSEGRVEKLCCEAKGEGKGEYRQTGYWDGNFVQCCDGKPYKTGEDEEGGEIYGCCIGSKGRKENRTHTVVEKAVGAPNGEGACCEIEKYGENPTAYWNGSSVQCCKGTAYTKVIDGVTYGVCCSEEIYGSNPSVYWNDKTGICCKNAFTEVQNRIDGAPEKVCCDHDIYGTSAEAYGSGTCCSSYERYNSALPDEPTIDVCCKGIGESPYCSPGDPDCFSGGCCPAGTSFSHECPWVELYDCWDTINNESGWAKGINAICDDPSDATTCKCPDGYEALTITHLLHGCC